MASESHRFLSSFQIACKKQNPKGALLPTERRQTPGKLALRMKDYTNSQGRYYEENHLEEWVARCPDALFPGRRIHVLASQNYAHLPEKIDLLVADDQHWFDVVEIKITSVAENGGLAPYQIHEKQMKRYVQFLTWYLPPFPESLRAYYTKFSKRFYGSPRFLDVDLKAKFGDDYCQAPVSELMIRQVYLTAGFDDYAVRYFSAQPDVAAGSIRLLYYRFFPEQDYIEFWEICLNG